VSVTPELEAMSRAYCWSANRDAFRDGERLHAFVEAHWRDHIRGLRHALRKIREPSEQMINAMYLDVPPGEATTHWDAWEQAVDHILGDTPK
jgi:hypothetical protein